MNKLNLTSIQFLYLFIVILLISCKKTGIPIIPETCKISSVTDSLYNSSYIITYNNSGKMEKVMFNNSLDSFIKYYTYTGVSIYIRTEAGINSSTDTITLNDLGLIASVKESIPNSVYHTSYSYNANGLLISTTSQQDNYTPTTTTYKFTNGDLTYIEESNNSKDTLTYYTDKISDIGNLTDFTQLLYYGAYYDKSKHLRKSYYSGTFNHVNYNYIFDPKGKIIGNIIKNDLAEHADTLHINYVCQ